MSEDARAILLDYLREGQEALDWCRARYYHPCEGTTRDGRPCGARSVFVGLSGYCHWHDPDRWLERENWIAARHGSRTAKWFARIEARYGHANSGRGEDFLDFHQAICDPPPFDLAAGLAALPAGQRRVVTVLLSAEDGLTYPQAAAALAIHVGTLHRHLGRIRAQHPDLYRAVMDKRAAQLATRHEQAEARERGRGGRRLVAYRAQHGGRAPWSAQARR